MAVSPTRLRLDPQLVRTCPSYKVSYDTRDEALDGCEAGMEKGLVMPGCHLTPYRCDQCGRWHICNRIIVPLGPHQRTTFQEM